MTTGVPSGLAVLDVDLFDEASLKEPVPIYRQLREAGPLVRLERPDVYAMARYHDVQAALRAPDMLISGEGVGFSDSFNAPKGMNVLQSDGPFHSRLRSVVMRPLTPIRLREVRGELRAMIEEKVRSLVGQGSFDAMKELAPFLPVSAVSVLVGLPEEGRGRMLEWAAATFNLIGPHQNEADKRAMQEAFGFMTSLDPAKVRPGSWAADLFAAAQNGRLSLQEAMAALSAYVIPSLDTTIFATGHLLYNLAANPDQWALLKQRPELVGSTVLESVRKDSVLRWFARVATEDYSVGGAMLPRGARVMLLYGAANRDERRYPEPDRFDITRDSRDHLAWGTGPHMCAGMHLARLEMEVLVEALLAVDASLVAGSPVMAANAGLYGFAELPFTIAGPA